MEQTTKEKILDAALVSIAENGYRGTNLRDLAAGMGLSKSALYKHYTSKEDIWNALLDEMEAYYAQRFGSPENLPPIPRSTEALKALTLQMLHFTIYDERIVMTRKILLTEQFHDERVRALATEHFNVGLESLFTKLFAAMMENGTLKKSDPAMLAFAYTAPVTTLVQLCDREPDRRAETMGKIETFITRFIDTYGETKNENEE